MLSYRQALDYIYNFANWETRGGQPATADHFDLVRIEALLARLGDPHRRFRSVHIAGTKGKGSVAAMLDSILRAANYRTGLYTSPHLHTFRERIQVDGQLITEEQVVSLVERLRPTVAEVPGITTFEVMTAMAFQHFADQELDVAVVEVGLGGRLDATNVILPLVSIITSLSLDHTMVLGRTLPEIAREKAGIIKPGVPVVSAPQPPEALAVIERVCQEKGAPLTVVGHEWTWQAGEASLEGQAFEVRGPQSAVRGLWIPLLGRHELVNATVVVAASHLLQEQGLVIPSEAMAAGLRHVHWPGRLEVLNRRPLVVVDGAHNGDSARRLAEALREYFTYQRLFLIFGVLYGHNMNEMLEALVPIADKVIVTYPRHHPRAVSADTVASALISQGVNPAAVTRNVSTALESALALAGPDDLILATGSLSVVAAAREAWAVLHGLPLPERDPPMGS